MRYVVALCLLALTAPVLASNPGEPLDCSDWVFLEPGLSCTVVISHPCPTVDPGWSYSPSDTLCNASNDHRAIDVEGNRLWVRRIAHPDLLTCGSALMWRVEVVRIVGSAVMVLGYVDERCNDSATSDFDRLLLPYELHPNAIDDYRTDGGGSAVVKFDQSHGRLLFTVSPKCTAAQGCAYGEAKALWAIDGFATTAEVLQTFTPTPDAIGFRVPYMPEGMQGASYFNTYTGDLATVGDWSQLQPLKCGYPVTAPSAGDYLTVADTLPTPAPGMGRYYLTVANYMGERRFGRKAINGTLSGRDPSTLPACTE